MPGRTRFARGRKALFRGFGVVSYEGVIVRTLWQWLSFEAICTVNDYDGREIINNDF